MWALKYVALIIAWASATYGIWSKPRTSAKDLRVAVIATAITSLGLFVGTALVYIDAQRGIEQNRAQKAEFRQQLEAIAATSDLNSLTIEWRFENVPPEVLKIFDVWKVIRENYLVSDDELSRADAELRRLVIDPMKNEEFIAPLIVAAALGKTKADDLFKGDVEEALKQEAANGDPLEFPSISYQGPAFTLLFPLNRDLSGVVALGKMEDDQVIPGAGVGGNKDVYEVNPFRHANYEFRIDATRENSKVEITWDYGRSSIQRAITYKLGHSRVTGGLPKKFSFAVIYEAMDRKKYQNTYSLAAEREAPKATERDWFSTSRLTVRMNAATDLVYVYDVTRSKTADYVVNEKNYYGDPPMTLFKYTRFDCAIADADNNEDLQARR